MEPNDFRRSAGTDGASRGLRETLSLRGILIRTPSLMYGEGKLPIGAPAMRGHAGGFWFGGSGYDGGGGGDGAGAPDGPDGPGDAPGGDAPGGDAPGGDAPGGDGSSDGGEK